MIFIVDHTKRCCLQNVFLLTCYKQWLNLLVEEVAKKEKNSHELSFLQGDAILFFLHKQIALFCVGFVFVFEQQQKKNYIEIFKLWLEKVAFLIWCQFVLITLGLQYWSTCQVPWKFKYFFSIATVKDCYAHLKFYRKGDTWYHQTDSFFSGCASAFFCKYVHI